MNVPEESVPSWMQPAKKAADGVAEKAVQVMKEGPIVLVEDIGQGLMDIIQTPEGIAALKQYTGIDYVNINNSLRGIETLTPENRAIVETIKSALDKASLSDDIILYRGTSTEALGSLKNIFVDDLIGQTFTELGFMSTSTSSSVASGSFSGNMQMTIHAPVIKGVRI